MRNPFAILSILAVGFFPALGNAATLTADHGGPYTADAGDTLTLDASGTTIDGAAYSECWSYSFEWDIDSDGTVDASSSSLATTSYDTSGLDGPYETTVTLDVVCLWVEGAHGMYTLEDSVQTTISLDNANPVIDELVAETVVDEGDSVTLSVAYSDPETADSLTVLWTLSDGTTSTADSFEATWADDAKVDGSVTITDDDGGQTTETWSILVENVAPTIEGAPDTGAVVDMAYSFAASFSDPGVEDTHTWSLAVAPAGAVVDSETGALLWTPSAQQAGQDHPFTLALVDDDGGSDELSWMVSVEGEVPDTGGDTGQPVDTGDTEDTGDTAEAQDSADEEPQLDTGGIGDGDASGSGDKDGGLCGCAGVGPASAGLVWLGGLLALLRRRRG